MDVVDNIVLADLPLGLHRVMLTTFIDNLGNNYSIPVIIIKTALKGPVVTVSSLIHGNELNGLGVVQQLSEILPSSLIAGTVILLPVINIPGFNNKERFFPGKIDLNWFFPGNKNGKPYEKYVYTIFNDIILQSDYLLDLHTARNGSANCYHVRGNMNLSKTKKIASLLEAELILHGIPSSTTMRGAAERKGVVALTLEIGKPNMFQKNLIAQVTQGILRVLASLKMSKKVLSSKKNSLYCTSSYKVETTTEGILELYPSLLHYVEKGEKIAVLKDIFGQIKKEFFAEKGGIVIGNTTIPVVNKGRTIIHIGVLSKKKYDAVR